MNATELKKQFNLLYNNINNNAAPGLSDAEIEMFLNKAQDEIVKQHVLGVHTNYQLGVNQTSKRDVELDTLIKTCPYYYHTGDDIYHPKGQLYTLTPPDDDNENTDEIPPNILMMLTEMISVNLDLNNQTSGDIAVLDVVELNYQQLSRFLAGIYKYPKKNQCWKIRHDSFAEIVFPVFVYKLMDEYIKDHPTPPLGYEDILADNGDFIGYQTQYVEMPPKIELTYTAPDTEAKGCSLPEVLHMEIVQRAVELAKAAYAAQDVNIQMSMGQRSE